MTYEHLQQHSKAALLTKSEQYNDVVLLEASNHFDAGANVVLTHAAL